MAAAVRISAFRLVGGGDAVGAAMLAPPVADLGCGGGALAGGSRAAVAATGGPGEAIGAWTGLAAGRAGTSASATLPAGAGTGADCVSPYPSGTPPPKMMIAQRRLDPPIAANLPATRGDIKPHGPVFTPDSTNLVFRKSEIVLAPSRKSVLKGTSSVKPKEGTMAEPVQPHSDVVEIAKRNGDFRRNYGTVIGAFLYLRSLSAARGRSLTWAGAILGLISLALPWLAKIHWR